MKLVTYTSADTAGRAGVLVDESVVDARTCAHAASLNGDVPWGSVKGILTAATETEMGGLDAAARDLASTMGTPLGAVRLHAPITDPEKILCIGLNYHDHVDEAQRGVDATLGTQADPVVFSKFSSALIGDGDHIVLPAVAPGMVDWEGELAVVIGKTCVGVGQADALDHVAGYTVLNDISARDVQLASPQWLMGKSFDTSGPCGPALVTRDEVPDPHDLELMTTINGEVMQRTNTALMINRIPRLIEYISALITLVPGDIIATGTPAGVGYAHDPKVFLRDGDLVSVTIETVGRLTNPVTTSCRVLSAEPERKGIRTGLLGDR
jgi:2-keto-4-pentenoate hydratase/2-oxohepta-3-ene-1,7-dioic acid hydratase in catechol pathway